MKVVMKSIPTFNKACFTVNDIPPLAFWQQTAKPPIVTDAEVTPEKCYSAVQKYVQLAVADAAGWRSKLFKSEHLSPYLLHYIAVMISTGPQGPAFQLALHIMQTLVLTLSYKPSVVTMVRMALNLKKLGQPMFADAEVAFRQLARKRDDPDVCTLQGLILSAKAKPEQDKLVLEWLQTAEELGGKEKGAWEWQSGSMLLMGKIHLRLGNKKKAREILKYCAEELDVRDACYEYGMLLEEGSEEREKWVLKAAVSGSQLAAAEMARMARTRFQDSKDMGRWERKARRVLMEEWEAVARV